MSESTGIFGRPGLGAAPDNVQRMMKLVNPDNGASLEHIGTGNLFRALGVPVATRTAPPPPLNEAAHKLFMEKGRELAPKFRTECYRKRRRIMQWLFLLGLATGMRSMTAMAVVCWFAWLRMLPVQNTWAFWAGNILSAIVFTVFALGEYIGDTLPRTPNRTAPGPAGARLVFGGLVGAIAATASQSPVAGGVLFGVAGAAVGTWGGIYVRRFLAREAGRDLPAALGESVLAIAISIFAARAYAEGIQKLHALMPS